MFRHIAAAFLLLTGLCSASSPARFYLEPNLGQSNKDVRYLARASGTVLFFTDSGMALRHVSAEGSSAALRIDFEDASREATWQALERVPGSTSYITGRDRGRWIHDVPHYGRVRRGNLYPGIDLIAYGSEGRLEYDFVLAPGADPNQVRLRFSGAKRLNLKPNGDLQITLPGGELIQKKPALYQAAADGTLRPVDGSYRLLDPDRVAFAAGAYDAHRQLTIDPILESATLLGGSGKDQVLAAGTVGLVGNTASADFPGVEAAAHRGTDIFIYVPASQTTTIIGGSGDDIVTAASVASNAQSSGIVVAGYTNSRDLPMSDYPLPQTGVQVEYGGGEWDGFVFVFSSNQYGSPSYATYIGGSGDDRVLALSAANGLWGMIAVAGSTTSTDLPVINAFQSSPGGGVDGFLSAVSPYYVSGSYMNWGLAMTSYLGGSGDDRALAVIALRSGNEFYVAGETASGDWELPWSGARNGASDAFLLRLMGGPMPAVTSAVLFGGSGEDRITALVTTPNGIAAAGATSSSDLSPQAAFAGGSSDVFLARFPADLSRVDGVSLIGGTGAEEPLSLATNSFGDILVAGWTSSTDFTLTDPTQSTYGGGDSDGFVLLTDDAGKRIFSTYYGGAGGDRITYAGFDALLRIQIGGYTDSADCPLKDPLQSTNAGATDGFYASIAVPMIHASGLTVGKDLAGSGYVTLSDPANHVGVQLTITSSDPSRVVLAARKGDPGTEAITVAIRAAEQDFAGRAFLAYCLSDSGIIPLTLAAPEYPSRTVDVRCVPSGLVPQTNDINVYKTAYTFNLVVEPAALEPDTNRVIQVQNPRAGIGPFRIDGITPGDSPVQCRTPLMIDTDTTLSPASQYGGAYIQCTSTGAKPATVSLTTNSAFPFVPSNQVRIHTSGAGANLYIPAVARDMMAQIRFASGNGEPVTFTSSDPSKVLLTTRRDKSGSASVTVDWSGTELVPQPYIEALTDSGNVSITASMGGRTLITTPVRFVKLTAFLTDLHGRQLGPQPVSISDAQEGNVWIWADIGGTRNSYDNLYLRPDAPRLSITPISSDPRVAEAVAVAFGTEGTGIYAQFTIKAQAPGTATVSPKSVSNPAPDIRMVPIRVKVPGARMVLAPLTVGNNLQAVSAVIFEGKQPKQGLVVTVTSSDPARLLLSTSAGAPGQASVTLPGSIGWSFYAQALAGSGEAEIAASAEGYDTVRARITLVPSGFAWVRPTVTLTAAASSQAALAVYALDPSTGSALMRQRMRPGVEGTITLRNSNSDVLTATETVPLSAFGNTECGSSCEVMAALTAKKPGEATVSIVAPEGFPAPLGSQALRVKIVWPAVVLGTITVGRNLQSRISLSPYTGEAIVPVTIESADPSKLVLSGSESEPGFGSITIRPWDGGVYPPLFVQALDGPADVKLTAKVDGLDPVTSVVRIAPSAIVFEGTNDIVTNTQAGVRTLKVFAVKVDSYSAEQNAQLLRAGIEPVLVAIESSNPAAAFAVKSPVQLDALTSYTTAKVKPVAPGTATLSIVQPPGFITPRNFTTKINVEVNGPAFTIDDFTVGKNLQTRASLRVISGTDPVPADVDVTIASGDPFKLLISTSGDTVGAGAVKLHIAAGQYASRGIYLQALDSFGEVEVQVSAPGYRTTTARVSLLPTRLVANSTPTIYRGSDQTISLAPAVDRQYFSWGDVGAFRPGMPELKLEVSSSDSSVFSIVSVSKATDSVNVRIHAAAAGKATLKVKGTDVVDSEIPIEIVVPAPSPILFEHTPPLGKDLQAATTLYSNGFGSKPVTVTFTSADPSRLLVSASPTTPGQASVTVTVPASAGPTVYLQALAASGTVKLTASAPDCTDGEATIQLTDAAVILAERESLSLTTLSRPVEHTARLTSTEAYPDRELTLRPGAAPVKVRVALSNTAIGSLSASDLVFQPGEGSKKFTFQPLAPGVGLLTLSAVDNISAPDGLCQRLITVNAARLGFDGSLSVGKDLQSEIRVTSIATVTPLAVTITSADPSRLLLAMPENPSRTAASVTVTIPAGNTTSPVVYLVGLASSGTVALSASAPGFTTVTSRVILQPSGFVFGAIYTYLGRGANISIPIQSWALDPFTLAPDRNLALRPGINPVSVSVTNSERGVIELDSTSVTLPPGGMGQSMHGVAKAAGRSVVTIQAPPGFSTPSSGTKVTLNVN